MNIYELMQYENERGPREAADFLLLIGPDHFEGDYDETMEALEKRTEREEA